MGYHRVFKILSGRLVEATRYLRAFYLAKRIGTAIQRGNAARILEMPTSGSDLDQSTYL